MKKGLVLYGSPKKNGNTSTLGKKLLQGLAEGGLRDIQEFRLNDLSIAPCQGCFGCRPSGRCVIQDDMQAIYPALESADVVVFAIPIYWWHMAAQVKLCIDRLTALLSEDDKLPALTGKEVVVIVSYNFPDCARGVIGMFEDFIGWIGIRLQVIEHCAKTGLVDKDKKKLGETFEIGKAIARRLVQNGM